MVILDTVGELAALYALAEVVFVGGSLVPIGGHNVLEPAMRGKPVLVGPHTSNFREGAELLQRSGGGLVVKDAPSSSGSSRDCWKTAISPGAWARPAATRSRAGRAR